MLDLSIVIVNYNSGGYLLPCLDSLADEEAGPSRREIVVVDSASPIDQSGALAAAEARGARVVRMAANGGYAGGCNRGLRESSGRLVLFLNADVKARRGCLRALVRHLEEHADVAFVEPATYVDDDLVFAIPEVEPLTPSLIVRQTLARLSRSAARRYSVARLVRALPSIEAAAPREQATLTGAFLMGRRDLMLRLGGFDEGYPLFFEDADLFLRTRQAGGRLVLLPDAKAIHHGHRSAATAWGEAMARYAVGRRRWLRRAHGRAAVALDRACERIVQAADRVRGARRAEPFVELDGGAAPPELALAGEAGPYTLELALDPAFYFAAIHVGAGDRFRFTEATWKSLPPGRCWLRALDAATRAPRGAWTVARA